MRANSEVVHPDWTLLESRNGVSLRESGVGQPLVVFPGMEGDGASCLHVVIPVAQQAAAVGTPYRLLLVDYSQEIHASFDELVTTISQLLQQYAGQGVCTFLGQSFGNLLAVNTALRQAVAVEKLALVSPFTRLPPARARLVSGMMSLTPQAVYRATARTFGEYAFGPVGDQKNHPFFNALVDANLSLFSRRTSWLVKRDFSTEFRSITMATKVWLGAQDRVVDFEEQRAFFTDLASQLPNYRLSVIPGAGHVMLPTESVTVLKQELLEWLQHENEPQNK